MQHASFLTEAQARGIRHEYGTPVYAYDERSLEAQAREVLQFPNAFGLTARYAMKALPNAAIVRLFSNLGLHIDASSGFEVERAILAGVPASHILLTAQQMPANLKDLVRRGVLFNACSLHQLESYGRLFPASEVSVRVNPGLGSGHSNRTNVGGPSSSFGIWHERLDQVFAIQEQYRLRITRLHTHIGSGADPGVWHHCAQLSLAIAARLPMVHTLNLGGGFKVGRMPGEISADLRTIGALIVRDFEQFYRDHGRKLRLEVEPGTFLVANAGAIVASVVDVVDTGPYGYSFIKVDSGMTEIVRPSMYGAQHPIYVVPATPEPRETREYVVVGHCCESGDVLTTEPGNPECLKPRALPETRIGDLVVIGGAGAYCSAMTPKNYNSFPEAPEIMVTKAGNFRLLRRRQTMDQMVQNETEVERPASDVTREPPEPVAIH